MRQQECMVCLLPAPKEHSGVASPGAYSGCGSISDLPDSSAEVTPDTVLPLRVSPETELRVELVGKYLLSVCAIPFPLYLAQCAMKFHKICRFCS